MRSLTYWVAAMLMLTACSQRVVHTNGREHIGEIRSYANAHDRRDAVAFAMRRHIDWIVTHSDLQYHGERLPPIRYTSQRRLSAVGLVSMYEATDRTNAPDVVDAIWLPSNIQFNLADSQKMLHEIGHFLQRVNGRYMVHSCVYLERQMLELEVLWMAEQGQVYEYTTTALETSSVICERPG